MDMNLQHFMIYLNNSKNSKKGAITLPRKKKTNFEPEIEEKLNYIGLDLDKIPKSLIDLEPLKFRATKSYDEKKYIQYRFVPIKDIKILISPTNRLEELTEKYSKARPIEDYIDNTKEDNLLRFTVFLNMIKQMDIDEIENVEKEQKKLFEKIPFNVKYQGNYLWQIYYSEISNKYFMIVPMEENNYSAFFYLLKKKIENKKEDKIFVPICNLGYSRNFYTKSQYKNIEDYLWLFTKGWPSIYEVYNQNGQISIKIIGETMIYENIKSKYRIDINNEKEANHFYKILKALFILQTELPNYFKFDTNVDEQGNLKFYFKNKEIQYSKMASFIKKEYAYGENLENEIKTKTKNAKKRLEELKEIASMQEIEYREKERQISTFLECKKTFFGKVKYYFKISKKNKKKTNVNTKKEEIIEKDNYEIIKDKEIPKTSKLSNHTIEELIDKFKNIDGQETLLKNLAMDVNAIKLKNKNMAKKIENATLFIDEIDNHKKSIFEFWKYSNKDAISVLPEGEEEEIGVVKKKIEKTFDFVEDFETFGIKLDEIQRENLTIDETDSIFVATTNILEFLNKILLDEVGPKEVENELKELKKKLRDKLIIEPEEDFDIFGSLIEDSRRIKKIGNKTHREIEKDLFKILEITKMTRQIGFKLTLEQIIENIENAFDKIKSPDDVVIYKAIVDDKLDENKINIFDIDSEKEIKKACKEDGEMINLYRINLRKGESILGFTNIIYYDNQNKTLPIGMNLSTNVIPNISNMDLSIKKSRCFQIACLEKEDDEFSDVIVKKVTVYE